MLKPMLSSRRSKHHHHAPIAASRHRNRLLRALPTRPRARAIFLLAAPRHDAPAERKCLANCVDSQILKQTVGHPSFPKEATLTKEQRGILAEPLLEVWRVDDCADQHVGFLAFEDAQLQLKLFIEGATYDRKEYHHPTLDAVRAPKQTMCTGFTRHAGRVSATVLARIGMPDSTSTLRLAR